MPDAAASETSSIYTRYYAVVSAIPKGCVATYGQVAALAGLPGRARQVGYALAALPDGTKVPWHRVVNARGDLSARGEAAAQRQRQRLQREGVQFRDDGRIDLSTSGA